MNTLRSSFPIVCKSARSCRIAPPILPFTHRRCRRRSAASAGGGAGSGGLPRRGDWAV